MKIYGLMLVLCISLLGCNNSEKKELNPIKQTKITVLCKGERTATARSAKEQTTYKSKISTSYVFTNIDNTFSFDRDGSIKITPLNYEYLEQVGKPKAVGNWMVNEQRIYYKQYFWTYLDEKNDRDTLDDSEISINRISGEWVERNQHSVKDRGKEWVDKYTLVTGFCENAAQKF